MFKLNFISESNCKPLFGSHECHWSGTIVISFLNNIIVVEWHLNALAMALLSTARTVMLFVYKFLVGYVCLQEQPCTFSRNFWWVLWVFVEWNFAFWWSVYRNCILFVEWVEYEYKNLYFFFSNPSLCSSWLGLVYIYLC